MTPAASRNTHAKGKHWSEWEAELATVMKSARCIPIKRAHWAGCWHLRKQGETCRLYHLYLQKNGEGMRERCDN